MNFKNSILIVFCLLMVTGSQAVQVLDPESPVHFVNVFVGTAASNVVGEAVPGGVGGATQPAAVVPFGMVQLGPDTDRPETSGYKYENTAIRSFSFTHMSGPGCRNMGEFMFMPFVKSARWPTPAETTFSHRQEFAEPGYYQVKLDNGIQVELTSTERTGWVRLNFANAPVGEIVGIILNTTLVGDGVTTGSVSSEDQKTLAATVVSGRFCASNAIYNVHMSMQFDRTPLRIKTTGGLTEISFVNDGRPLIIKGGLSLVSQQGARLNLNTESPGFDFDSTRARAFALWDEALSTVQVQTTGSIERLRVFYTALYHSLLHPNVGSDVDGNYLGHDHKIHLNTKRPYYVNFSGWDIYRSQVQLLALLFPKRAADMAQAMVNQGLQGGALPKWSLNNVETNIMSGDPGSLILANLYAFGAKNFDLKSALAMVKKNATDSRAAAQGKIVRQGGEDYNSLGFIRHSKVHWASASITLELASADYGIAQFAKSVGDEALSSLLFKRSRNWVNLWDPNQKYIRPRLDQTTWLSPFTPESQVGFMEGNSAQYTWMIPHDLRLLIQKMGGDEAAIRRLDDFMSQGNAGQNTAHLYLGNEPSFTTPWVYLWAHAPWRTQEVVRQLLKEQFLDTPGGLPGNDDLGALSSWAVWSMMGMFPALPGSGVLVIGSPVFSEMTINAVGKRSVKIIAPEAENNIYVKDLSVDGASVTKAWIDVDTLRNATEVRFSMSPSLQKWGSELGQEPP